MFYTFGVLRGVLNRWIRQRYTDDGHTQIDDYGARVLRAVDEEIGRGIAASDRPRSPVERRADCLAAVAYLERVSSWPYHERHETFLRDKVPCVSIGLLAAGAWIAGRGFAYELRAAVDPLAVANMAALLERELDDWVLVVSDGTQENDIDHAISDCVVPIAAQGRAALELAVMQGSLRETFDVDVVTPPPPSAGLWIKSGVFSWEGDGEDAQPMLTGEWRPATPDDLALLGVGRFQWTTETESDGDQLRATVIGMHAAECPIHVEARTWEPGRNGSGLDYSPGDERGPFDEPDTWESRARRGQIPCGCSRFAAHPWTALYQQTPTAAEIHAENPPVDDGDYIAERFEQREETPPNPNE